MSSRKTEGGGRKAPGAAPARKEGVAFGPGVGGALDRGGKDSTIEFDVTATIQNGVTLFRGADVGGSKIGSGEGDDKDVTIRLRGRVVIRGGAAADGGEDEFGGGEVGGPKIGSPEGEGGEGSSPESQRPVSQSPSASYGRGGGKAGGSGAGKSTRGKA